MKELRLTSPGVLLIAATILTGGIFLLDLFYLQPHVRSQQQSVLRDQAHKARQMADLALQVEQGNLTRSCQAWASTTELRQLARAVNLAQFAVLAARELATSGIQHAALTDDRGAVLASWSSSGNPLPPCDFTSATRADQAPKADVPAEGLVRLGANVAIFAQQQVPDAQGPSTGRRLWIARTLDTRLAEKFSAAIGAEIVFVPFQDPPRNVFSADASSSVLATIDAGDFLPVAWLVHDEAGQPLGYFQAKVPVTQIHRQANANRRTILIILSLSVGLVLLIIMGMHVLVAGPVVRLLQRLQRIDAGSTAAGLSRDLHGEPLVLARRLESAFEKLSHLSKTDQLTSLANRRHFEEILDCFYHQSRRYSRPLSLMLIDIDFFKAINDTGGHQAGDTLLRAIAQDIETSCRKADLPARWGGDEFAVLLPETSCTDAELIAQRIRQLVAHRQIELKTSGGKVTLSIGIADLNAGEIDGPDAMIALADRALYAAKELGRDRIVQAHDLNSLTWPGSSESSGKVDVLQKKLAGLDLQLKDLFIRAVEEVVGILAQRDPHMALHAHKVQHYVTLIAREMELPRRVIKRLQIAAMLHDIGMIAMPDSVLLCPGALNEQQLQVMRRHPLLSVRIMEGMEFLEQEIPAVRYHHERFDGKGYPEGISGPQIPLTARILAVADAFVAITSPRTFRPPRPFEQALDIIQQAAGSQFDPAVVGALAAVANRLGQAIMDLPPQESSPSLSETLSQQPDTAE